LYEPFLNDFSIHWLGVPILSVLIVGQDNTVNFMSHLQDIQIIVTPDQLITSVSCMAENRENKLRYCKVSNSNNPRLKNYSQFSAQYPGNKLLSGDSDLYILQVAQKINGIVLYKNQYRQYWDTKPFLIDFSINWLSVPILSVLIIG
jgi:hypothetical protein